MLFNYILDFNVNLILVTKLTKQLSCSLSLTITRIRRGDWFLWVESTMGSTCCMLGILLNLFLELLLTLSHPSLILSYFGMRLGHPSQPCYNLIRQNDTFISTTSTLLCNDWLPYGKTDPFFFPISTSKTSAPFELLRIDIWGKYKVPTCCGHQYFLTTVDDYSRVTWVLLLTNKSEVYHRFKKFCYWSLEPFSISIKGIKSDNGVEFTSSQFQTFLQQLGIRHQRSCPILPNRTLWLRGNIFIS